MSKRLDYIIRTILNEQLRSKLVTSAEQLNSAGRSEIKKLLPAIYLNDYIKEVDEMDQIYGFYIDIMYRTQIPKADDPRKQLTPTEIQDAALEYVDGPSLGSSVWSRNRNQNYVWFISDDLLKKPTGKFKNKYRVLFIYINKKLFKETVQANLTAKRINTGRVQFFKAGAPVYSISINGETITGINKSEWEPRNIGSTGLDYGMPGQFPVNDAKFGDIDTKTARQIWMWFDGEKLGVTEYIPNNNYTYYSCVQREIVKWFQKKNNLTDKSGNWNQESRLKAKEISDAFLLKTNQVTGEEERLTLSSNTTVWFSTSEIDQLKKDIAQCVIDTKQEEISTVTTKNIIVPSGGFKKDKVTLPEDKTEFYKFQQLMLEKYELLNSINDQYAKKFPLTWPVYVEFKNALQQNPKAQGSYGKLTQEVLNWIITTTGGPSVDNNTVTSDVVKHLESIIKTNLIGKQ